MGSTINTNIASLNAQRNLSTSQSSLATSLARLSSGLRINSAKDDAAGLAIASRMTTQINGLNQAVRNANDGISLAQTGDSVLGEITNNLQRIRELAVQSANATNSNSDRAAIDQEVQQRLAEIDRLGSTTSFNGRKILDGSFGNASFQIGANVSETISVGLGTSMRQDAIGAKATSASIDLSAVITAATGGVTGVTASYTSAAITNFNFATTTPTATTSGLTSGVYAQATSTLAAPRSTTSGLSSGAYVQANSVKTAATTTTSGLSSGAYVQAASTRTAAAVTTSGLSSGAYVQASSTRATAVESSSGVSGAYIGATSADATDKFKFTIDGIAASNNAVGAGGVLVATLQNDIATYIGTTGGAYAFTGDLATNDLVITKANGTAVTLGAVFTDAAGTGAAVGVTGGGTFATAGFIGAHNNGAVVGSTVATDAFQLKVDGVTWSDQAVGAATAVNLLADIDAKIATSGGLYSRTGTVALGTLVINRADGNAMTLATSYSNGVGSAAPAVGTVHTGGTFATAGFIGAHSDGGVAGSSVATDAFQFKIDGVVASDRLVGNATAANLQTDILAYVAASGGAYTRTGSVATNDLVISKTDGSDMTLATSFSNGVGSAGAAVGNVQSGGTFATAGFAGAHTDGSVAGSTVATDAFQFKVDGVVWSDRLVGAATATNLLTDIDTKIAASGGLYTRSGTVALGTLVINKTDGNSMTLATSFSNGVGSAGAAVGNTQTGGTFATAGFVGAHADGAVAGSTVATDAFQFKIDGNIASDRLVGNATAANLQTDILAYVAASGGAYTRTGSVATNDLVISKTDGTDMTLTSSYSDAVGSTDAALGTVHAGGTFATASFIGAHTDGELASTAANRSFTFQGPGGSAQTVTLNTDVGNMTGLIAAITGTAGGGYAGNVAAYAASDVTVSDGGNGKLAFTATLADTAGDITISGANEFDTGGTAVSGVTTVAADPGAQITVSNNFSIGVDGANYAVANGTYSTQGALVRAINTALSGNASASVSNNVISIDSSKDIAITGAVGRTTLGFSASTLASGSLATVSVIDVPGANEAIQRIDSALNSVSTLRSTFGAMQNRFDSAIASLQATSENVSAAKSRIQDTDFAAETGNMTRNQILQQAGVAMLAQANALPQTVLSLLK